MSFTSDVHRISEKYQADFEEIARGSFIELFTAVIFDTPVDIGRLRGNWQCTKNSPASSDVDRTGGSGAKAEVDATVTNLGVYYLTNNLPYAERIEYGWSRAKAPEGMVRRNVQRFPKILRKNLK